MIANVEQKLIKKLQEAKAIIEILSRENLHLKNEFKKLSLSISRGATVNEATKLEYKDANNVLQGASENDDSKAPPKASDNEQFIIPARFIGKLSRDFLTDIMEKNKLDLKTMNLSLAGFAYDLQKQTLKLEGSLSSSIEKYFKQNIGYDSANYFSYLDLMSNANKTEDTLKKMNDRNEEIKAYTKVIEDNSEEFERERAKNPDFINKFKPIRNEKLSPNFSKGTPNYNEWVSNWLNNK